LRFAVAAGISRTFRTTVEPFLNAITLTVEVLINAIAFAVQAFINTLTFHIPPLIDSVAAVFRIFAKVIICHNWRSRVWGYQETNGYRCILHNGILLVNRIHSNVVGSARSKPINA
jgi:membrane protein YdbS with pleckstrin-like domain